MLNSAVWLHNISLNPLTEKAGQDCHGRSWQVEGRQVGCIHQQRQLQGGRTRAGAGRKQAHRQEQAVQCWTICVCAKHTFPQDCGIHQKRQVQSVQVCPTSRRSLLSKMCLPQGHVRHVRTQCLISMCALLQPCTGVASKSSTRQHISSLPGESRHPGGQRHLPRCALGFALDQVGGRAENVHGQLVLDA